MVDTAVAVLELGGLGVDGQRQQLVAEADAEDRHIGLQQLLEVRDDLDVLRRVAGAVGQHHAVVLADYVLRLGVRRNNRDLTAALAQLALDVVLYAVVEQRDAVLGFALSRVNDVLVAGNGLDRILDNVSLHLLDGLLVRLKALGVDDAVHDALAAQLAGQTAGVDAGEADNLLRLEVLVERYLAAPVGRIFAHLAHDEAGDPALARLVVVKVDAVVADERVGHGNDLTVVGRVGQDLLIAGHAGVEYDLADALSLVADCGTLEQSAVRQQ